MKQRLQKILSHAGIASRRAAEKLIEEGRVEVDGEVVHERGTSADPDRQDIRVDGARVRASRPRRYVALHKPRGYVTTKSDPSRRPTVMDLLPPTLQSLFPVGRLDMFTSGLLILTDDGELAQQLTHPRFGVEKSYLVTLSGRPDDKVLERATRGIVVDSERLAVEEIEVLSARAEKRPPAGGAQKTRLRATLRRGKNREIRRLFEALGFPVTELHRERIGGLTLRGIPLRGYRILERREVELLRGRRPEPGARERAHPTGPRGGRAKGRPKKSRSKTTKK